MVLLPRGSQRDRGPVQHERSPRGIVSQFIPIEVQYSDTFPDVKYYDVPTHEVLMTLFGTKSAAWKHEEEWRLVLRTVGYVLFRLRWSTLLSLECEQLRIPRLL